MSENQRDPKVRGDQPDKKKSENKPTPEKSGGGQQKDSSSITPESEDQKPTNQDNKITNASPENNLGPGDDEGESMEDPRSIKTPEASGEFPVDNGQTGDKIRDDDRGNRLG